MASVVVLPPKDQETPRKALLGLAIAQGLQGLASTLFTIAERRKEREIEETKLAQQLMLQQDKAAMSKQRMDDMRAYRAALIDMQQQGIINMKEYRDATLGLRRDEIEERSRHNQTIEALSAQRVGIAAANAAQRKADKANKPTVAKDPTLLQAMEDIDRIDQGLQPKYAGGVKVKTPEQKARLKSVLGKIIEKKTRGPLINPLQQFMAGAMNGAPPPAGPAVPTPAPAAPPLPTSGSNTSGNSFGIPGVR